MGGVCYVEAYWTRARGYRSSATVAGFGSEERAGHLLRDGRHQRDRAAHNPNQETLRRDRANRQFRRNRQLPTGIGTGRIKRSSSARADFMRQTGYPKGRKGYVVDHIISLECGGADTPSNMQWQTVQEAKIKDRSERNCRRE